MSHKIALTLVRPLSCWLLLLGWTTNETSPAEYVTLLHVTLKHKILQRKSISDFIASTLKAFIIFHCPFGIGNFLLIVILDVFPEIALCCLLFPVLNLVKIHNNILENFDWIFQVFSCICYDTGATRKPLKLFLCFYELFRQIRFIDCIKYHDLVG